MKVQVYKTPAIPGVGITKPLEDSPRISEEMQQVYRSCVGSILYLVKHSRPDLSNCVRELSKVKSSATAGNFKQLVRAVKFIETTRKRGLIYRMKIENDQAWRLTCYSDSDWAGDKDSRKSVTGWAIFLCRCLVSWGSRGQKTVSLSSSEAEYVALTEVSKEVLFVRSILSFLDKDSVEYPIVIHCDNVGAIFLSNNSESRRTKYLDTKYHFVRHYVENGVIKVVFVTTETNLADPFTKNVNEKEYEKRLPISRTIGQSMGGCQNRCLKWCFIL